MQVMGPIDSRRLSSSEFIHTHVHGILDDINIPWSMSAP